MAIRQVKYSALVSLTVKQDNSRVAEGTDAITRVIQADPHRHRLAWASGNVFTRTAVPST